MLLLLIRRFIFMRQRYAACAMHAHAAYADAAI